MSTRRNFLTLIPLSLSGLAACGDKATPGGTSAAGSGAAMVSPQDPAAVALGYVAVATQADASKYTKYEAGQDCSNCTLYSGQPGAADGPCPLFAGRHVTATGWCTAYSRKA